MLAAMAPWQKAKLKKYGPDQRVRTQLTSAMGQPGTEQEQRDTARLVEAVLQQRDRFDQAVETDIEDQ